MTAASNDDAKAQAEKDDDKPAASSPKEPKASSPKKEKPAASSPRFPSKVEKRSDLNGLEGHPDYNRALAQLCADGIVNAVKASASASKARSKRAQDLIDAGAEITPPARYAEPRIKPEPEDFITVRDDSNGDLVGVTSYGTKVRVHPDGSSTIQAGPGYDPAADIEVAPPLEVEESAGEPGDLGRIGGGIQARSE